MRKLLALTMLSSILCGATACTTAECWSRAKKIYSSPSDTWPAKLGSMPLDQRFDTYVCGIKHVHPAPLGLAHAVARGDGPVLETMVQHLERSADRDVLSGAANVVVEYSNMHPERVCKNQRVFRALDQARHRLRHRYEKQHFNAISAWVCRNP